MFELTFSLLPMYLEVFKITVYLKEKNTSTYAITVSFLYFILFLML